MRRIGQRQHRATFKRHNGQKNGSGHATLNRPDHWDVFREDWPCSMTAVNGGETIRGRQVAEHTSHVLIGEYQGALGVTPAFICVIDGVTRQIVSVMDEKGDRREMRIELKREGT